MARQGSSPWEGPDPAAYYRRRSDELMDERLATITAMQIEQSAQLRRLEQRINVLFGGLAALVTLANMLAPIISQLTASLVGTAAG